MANTTIVIDDVACYVQIEGRIYNINTNALPVTVPAGTEIYPFIAFNTGAPVLGACIGYPLIGCNTDAFRPCVIDIHTNTFISYGTVRYNNPIKTPYSGISLPKIIMPSDDHLTLKFVIADTGNGVIAQGRLFEIPLAPAERTQNTCPPYYGKFRIVTEPTQAGVYVDGAWQGYSPIEVCMLKGIRSLKFTKSGYLDKVVSFQVTDSEANADIIWSNSYALEKAPIPPVCTESEYRCKTGTTTRQQCQNNTWVDTNDKDILCGYIGNAPCRELTVEVTRIDPITVTPGSTASVYIKVHNPSTAPSNPCKVNLRCTAGDTSWAGTSIDVPGIQALGYSPELRGAYTATANAKGTVNICASIDTIFGL